MPLQILSFDLHQTHLQLRMPFRYGIATMTRAPAVFLRVRVQVDDDVATGISSDLLPPKWFTKIAAKPIEEEFTEMRHVIQHAAAIGVGQRGESAFTLWRQLYEAQADWGRGGNLPPLLCHLGTSLIERATLEAVCRAKHATFAEMLRADGLGIRLGEIHPALRGRTPSEFLPAAPLSRILARHTIGLTDPLVESDIPPDERLADGLPQSLASSIKRYDLRHFKIKINGDLSRDVERIARIAAVIRQEAHPQFAFSVDGNEQFTSLEEFRTYWEDLTARAELQEFFRHLLFIEQPLSRGNALREEMAAAFARWPDRPPVIIDESDATLEDLPAALQIGYAGTSHKNCKGVFKGIANRCLLAAMQQEQPARRWLMSGEDLCNTGPIALLQDLAVMAALGIQSVERNGHHYHAGLSQFPQSVQEQILHHHDGLYERTPAGWPSLRLVGGEIDLQSVNRAPFGVGFVLEVDQFERAAH